MRQEIWGVIRRLREQGLATVIVDKNIVTLLDLPIGRSSWSKAMSSSPHRRDLKSRRTFSARISGSDPP